MGLNKEQGLSFILGDMDAVYSKELGLDKKEIIELSIAKIKTNPFQPRKNFNEEALNELAQSIKEHGLIQPIIVVKNGTDFTLVAGERRLRASKILGLKKISAIICDAKEDKLRELALIENIQRENLNPIELAHSYKSLIEEYKITQENLSTLIHKSRTQITNTLRLLNLDEKTQKLIAQGKLSQGHAKVLVGLNKDDEKVIVDSIIGQKLNVRQTEKIAQSVKNKEVQNLPNRLEFEAQMQNLKKILEKLGFECKNSKENLTICLSSIEKIKKLVKILK
ncbi:MULTISPECIES: ParB/RepB/Spo0J family partition protein [unclassified Campylobacter]|uniref:ParB/RepB/Spo0J family partition protein n=1 Tax=unclassified Campylobacter TaxID=2593542 RepID=UPI0012383A7D|nr:MULTISPECIES: ParB/RepB/Spo0J family partition protein [unclassified Campylobacter]KAA6227323.1 ParB/RepB/Spo0J family partition protein [Campylobacter sp. LR286c]KAA6227802.1 ParB/RepB/Spo0J family partition protein [Campylobacter sp. LR185c]KAA6228210.1 ParB/RepB/Spo0J family partition protein [Campylobacter sp. LR196d]KAA6229210.1 ParB/RepB/Spo0J family partition protein [Campylobacter sp. LR291e]KAA6231015.1 ParB/RepB/Spo0J family partition protein [Campylobacter sp. LR264d]